VLKSTNESGRSLLEMILIFVVMALISFGCLKLYSFVMINNEANVIHEDLMIRGRLNQEGRPNQKKSFSTDLDNKTRLGKAIVAETKKENGAEIYHYSFMVENVKKDICDLLIKKNYKGAERITINGYVYGVDATGAIDEDVNCPNELNSVKLTFKKTTGKSRWIRKICKTDDDCRPSKRRCINGVCTDTCPTCDEGQCCFQAACTACGEPGPTPCDACPADKCCENDECVECPSPDPDPKQCPTVCCDCDLETDMCTKCIKGYHLTEDGRCVQCPTYSSCPPCNDQPDFECILPFIKSDNGERCICPAGYFIDEENKTCELCPENTFSSSDDSTECTSVGECKKVNDTRTGQEDCSHGDDRPVCNIPEHKYLNESGQCVCYPVGQQGDCAEGFVEDGNCNCVQCVADAQCNNTQCNLDTHLCCPTDTPFWNSESQMCYNKCSTDADCSVENGGTFGYDTCDPQTQTCVDWCYNQADGTSCKAHYDCSSQSALCPCNTDINHCHSYGSDGASQGKVPKCMNHHCSLQAGSTTDWYCGSGLVHTMRRAQKVCKHGTPYPECASTENCPNLKLYSNSGKNLLVWCRVFDEPGKGPKTHYTVNHPFLDDPPGYFYFKTSTSQKCQSLDDSCPMGYYIDSDSVCKECTGNTFTNTTNATQCIDCGAGTANETHTACICSENAITNSQGVCIDCGAGTANDDHTDCDCYTNATHDDTTLLCSCPSNKQNIWTNPSTGITSCVNCPQTVSGQTSNNGYIATNNIYDQIFMFAFGPYECPYQITWTGIVDNIWRVYISPFPNNYTDHLNQDSHSFRVEANKTMHMYSIDQGPAGSGNLAGHGATHPCGLDWAHCPAEYRNNLSANPATWTATRIDN